MTLAQPASGPNNYPHSQAAKKAVSILLVEDNRSDVLMVAHMLYDASQGVLFQITDVSRLKDALHILDKKSFDVVLLDLNLLDVEGVAGVAALHAEAPNLPILVYSGSHDHAMKEQALLCGAKHFLVKGNENGASLKSIIEQSLTPRIV